MFDKFDGQNHQKEPSGPSIMAIYTRVNFVGLTPTLEAFGGEVACLLSTTGTPGHILI